MTTRRQQLLEFAVLGLLHEGPQHGYELRKRLNLALGPFRALSFGTLYPALRALVAHGYLSESADPASAPASRRPRITYELTDAGRSRFGRKCFFRVRARRVSAGRDSKQQGGASRFQYSHDGSPRGRTLSCVVKIVSAAQRRTSHQNCKPVVSRPTRRQKRRRDD